MLAVVFQDVKLLPMTIAQNVASDVGTHIDRERVRECLTLSGLWQKVSSLPQKKIHRLVLVFLMMESHFPEEKTRNFGWRVRYIKMHRCFF